MNYEGGNPCGVSPSSHSVLLECAPHARGWLAGTDRLAVCSTCAWMVGMLSDVGVTLESTDAGVREYGECAGNTRKRTVTGVRTRLRGRHLHLPKGDTMIYAIAVGTLLATVAVVWRISRPRRYVIARFEIESWEGRQR